MWLIDVAFVEVVLDGDVGCVSLLVIFMVSFECSCLLKDLHTWVCSSSNSAAHTKNQQQAKKLHPTNLKQLPYVLCYVLLVDKCSNSSPHQTSILSIYVKFRSILIKVIIAIKTVWNKNAISCWYTYNNPSLTATNKTSC